MKRAVRWFYAAVGVPLACVALVVADLGIKAFGVGRTFRMFRMMSPTFSSGLSVHDPIVRLECRIVRCASRITRASCLRYSLVMWWTLRWSGVASEIHLEMGSSSGHAWVESNGFVIGDNAVFVGRGKFQPLSALFRG